jgi:hypothetical protein
MKIFLLLITFMITSYGNEFTHYQWGLNNSGDSVNILLTDINEYELPAIRDEDIQANNVNETDRVIKVAIIDSGIDLAHPDLKNKIIYKASECEYLAQYQQCLTDETQNDCDKRFLGIDSDGNGYPLDCQGWNVAAPKSEFAQVQGNPFVDDQIGHGTFVSGIIAAEDNKIGIKGVIQNVKIVPIKVSGSDEDIEEENATDIFAKGIDYAINEKVDVINLSLGWPSNNDSLLVTKAIEKAIAQGIIIIVAAGNSAHSEITYPCSYNEVICVGAYNPDGTRTHFTNYGASIDLYAPGRHILSTWPLSLRPKKFTIRHGYEFKDGTSFAAPFVTGAAALLLNQGFSPLETKIKLLSGARNKSRDQHLALAGKLDITHALQKTPSEFIYPYKKTPALINWNRPIKSMQIKLKNYSHLLKNIKISIIAKNKNISFLQKDQIINEWDEEEVKTLKFEFEAPLEMNSDLEFKIIIKTNKNKFEYPLQGKAITVIHDGFKRKDTKTLSIHSRKKLSLMSFRPIENINIESGFDLLVIDERKNFVNIALLKNFNNHFKLSPFHKLDLKSATFSDIVKIDLDLDRQFEYVLISHQQINDKWQTKFFVYDDNFKQINYEICPNNTFDNNITAITADIRWILIDGKMVPSWISNGFAPEEDLTPLNPWEAPSSNKYEKRIYYLSSDRIHAISIGEEVLPIAFYKQDRNEQKIGRVKILYADREGFVKKYYVRNLFENDFFEYELEDYQNLFELSFHQVNQQIIFTHNNLDDYTTTISSLKKNELVAEQIQYTYEDVFDPIQTVFSKTSDDEFYALTKYNLLHLGPNGIVKSESRNTHYQIQYKTLKKDKGLYLSGLFTPGYSSEVIQYDKSSKSLIRNAKYRFVPYTGCQELGLFKNNIYEYDFITFYCERENLIHFIKI